MPAIENSSVSQDLLSLIQSRGDNVLMMLDEVRKFRESLGIYDNEMNDGECCDEKCDPKSKASSFINTWNTMPDVLRGIASKLYRETNLMEEQFIKSRNAEPSGSGNKSAPSNHIEEVSEAICFLNIAVDYFEEFAGSLTSGVGCGSLKGASAEVPIFRDIWVRLPDVFECASDRIGKSLSMLRECIYEPQICKSTAYIPEESEKCSAQYAPKKMSARIR